MIVSSPIPYGAMSAGQLRLMLVLIAVTCGGQATSAVLSWRRLAKPTPRLASVAGVGHLVWLASMLVLGAACVLGAVTVPVP
jgi:hypothetical protein